ncbi:RluA family pseudouridine synthase [Plasticicumulans acidivorans]|uniref:Pseudouridine synthase n=1 Tax=Plasticicumulans acidivorans TaxID=886464 RepID=A0A317MT68_9GAMM|nr:RluA family pseudouridine synthase [Plasticicumulans acidivorans]PWV59508.1 ribosomal large subunit pseudouridine synthase C [Plasticicumulans acidivorans]
MTQPEPHPSPVAVRFVEVPADCDGQRIDNFLLRTLKGVPKSLVYRILRKGEVRVNKGRSRPEHRLKTGDVVRIPPLRLSPETEAAPVPGWLQERLQAAILHEDRRVLVLDKPSGVAVHKGSGIDVGVIEALRAMRPQGGFLELAHRLDRDTSGVLVLAKTPEALRGIHDALNARSTEKRYLAFVRGHWQLGSCRVDAPLRKGMVRGGERMVEVAADGKPSVSHFRLVRQFGPGALVEITIETGRTHQIRVHAAHMGHPLAGDDKYGDSDFNRLMAGFGLHRLFLHAQYLALPLGERELVLSAPLGAELGAVLDALEAAGG